MADKTFRLEIIAPDRIFYSNDIYMVEYNTVEGEVGIYADHIPMTQIIAPGRLIITERNEEKQAALLSGFVEITPEKMTILASNTLDFLPLDRAGNRRFLPIMIYPENAEVHHVLFFDILQI